MTVYSINLGIGWASSGVEYAQAYRAQVFRKLGLDAKFLFTDLILADNLAHLTRHLGFRDEEVLGLYQSFTDVKVSPSLLKLEDILALQEGEPSRLEDQEHYIRVFYEDQDLFLTCYKAKQKPEIIERVELVSKGILIRKDYYSYVHYCSEFFAPIDQKAVCIERAFYNEDGSLAYQVLLEEEREVLYRFPDKLLYSKQELVAAFLKKLQLKKEDWVLLDRETGIGQSVFQHVSPARLGVVVHAEHYSEARTDQDHILWNNYYDYQFTQSDKVSAFIVATQKQADKLEEQFAYYYGKTPHIKAIPVGALKSIGQAQSSASPKVLTASRLASEKHIDWLIRAVVAAKREVADLTFDIYGKGGQETSLQSLIKSLGAESYIQLKGHAQMDQVYPDYQAYLSASTSEGFGLTLMEAVGAGLAMVGFDLPYGNQTFIQNEQNGYLIPFPDQERLDQIVQGLSQAIVELFKSGQLQAMQAHSNDLAQPYLEEAVAQKWKELLEGGSQDA